MSSSRTPLVLLTALVLASALALRPEAALGADAAAPRMSVLFVKSPMRAEVDAARASLQERRPELLACYQRELAKDPEATVTLSWTLQASGAVSMPKAEFFEPREDPAGDRFLECLTARAARWTFPKPEGGAAPISVGIRFSTSTSSGVEPAEEAQAAGPIDKDTLRSFLQAHAGEIQKCYEQALAEDKLLGGKVTLRWTVQPDGSVVDASVDEAGTTLRNRKVHDCMLARVVHWKFPRPEGGGPAVIRNLWVLSRQ
jgi:hypothetical protein